MVEKILAAYGLTPDTVEPLGNGLINRTWKVTAGNEQYVLQRVNQNVFQQPQHIATNLEEIGNYLAKHHPAYLFTRSIAAATGEELLCVDGAYYRLFPFVSGSHSKDVAGSPQQAFEAARQFGKFTRLLSGFDVGKLHITLPHFHDLRLRYGQFLASLQKGNRQRISESASLINALKSHADIVTVYDNILLNPSFKLRVTHHDTKISNVLFDEKDKGLCVIDLDTVMPGYFISDVGDMMRTYLSPVSEEESDFEKIDVREEVYKAVVEGYYAEMKDELTNEEKQGFFYAGTFMIYMQALRFLTDHLNNDVYYGAAYEGHNYIRAKNQLTLLERLLAKQEVLNKSISHLAGDVPVQSF
ncbi:aminoglycoside phosphotransferase family protein [Flavisolibacter ginsenosidimutans]|uniref:Aminoglycoside phosphotransferase family protein n=2 Tax=Flavisolibacter ginsenosidimutans TaxID=661481 RepID=A0A5B8UCM7_9BACT|nr:aminoglycoside phosphotransferase family protein [Flavisolibacter ginsenosidimutans]QEC54427.1 aminoglycoside phosphotransferase family protein [Flavisolibacter ginsenosidimutans]